MHTLHSNTICQLRYRTTSHNKAMLTVMTKTESREAPCCRKEFLILSHAERYHISDEQRWQSLMFYQSLAHHELVN